MSLKCIWYVARYIHIYMRRLSLGLSDPWWSKHQTLTKRRYRSLHVTLLHGLCGWSQLCINDYIYTGLFEMIVGVLTTCHTQYTGDFVFIFHLIEQHATFLLHTLQVLYMCTLCDSTNINTIIVYVPNWQVVKTPTIIRITLYIYIYIYCIWLNKLIYH